MGKNVEIVGNLWKWISWEAWYKRNYSINVFFCAWKLQQLFSIINLFYVKKSSIFIEIVGQRKKVGRCVIAEAG
jgi:hypothetical protein